MRTSRLYPPAAALLAAAAIALPASTAAREKKPDNLVSVGEPISCINPRLIRSTHVRDDQTIDFEMTGKTVYRNTLPYKCSSLGFEERFSYKLSTSQLCSVDIITVLHSYGGGLNQGASCGLGQFQKMEKASK